MSQPLPADLTTKQRATAQRVMRAAGYLFIRRDGDNIILGKNGREVAEVKPNGHIYNIEKQ